MLFAHIQYPIIDFRQFLNDEYKREVPVFPAPNANTWLRNFGHVRERRTDTCPYYIAENYFCDAHNAVRFEKLPLIREKEQNEYDFLGKTIYSERVIFDKICKFRRFRSDGNLKACFEIGMETNPVFDNACSAHWELKELFVDVKSYTSKRQIRKPLFEIGNQICKLYEDSTSIKKTPIKTVYSGSPFVVYIDYSNSSNDNYSVVSYKEFYRMGIGLKHYKHENDNFWIIVPWKYHYDKKLLASIRRALLAISLEKEALLSAYNFLILNADKSYINEEKVLCYIKKTQEKLLRRVRFDIPQSPIVDTLFKLDFENNKAFYYDIINLISKFGDKYLINDFNKLFIKLEFNEWRKKIIKLLETTDDKDLRGEVKQLRDICIAEDKGKFWTFVYKYKFDDIFRNVFANGLYDLFKLVKSALIGF